MEQRTPEWYAARVGRITASSVGAILGLSPYMKPQDVMRQMVREYHGAEREFTGNAATEYGVYNEPLALADYEFEYEKVEKCGFFPKGLALGASPDGLIGQEGIIEIKCPYSLRDGGEFKSIDDQPHYYAQIQFQLYCTNRQYCSFYQWSAHGHKLETVWRNDDWLDEYLPIIGDFYARYLVEREQPNAQYYLEPKHKANGDDIAKELVEQYQKVSEALKDLEAQKKALLDEIVQACGEKDSEINGHKLTKVTREGAISYAKVVKDLLPDADLSAYQGKSTEYWRLN